MWRYDSPEEFSLQNEKTEKKPTSIGDTLNLINVSVQWKNKYTFSGRPMSFASI